MGANPMQSRYGVFSYNLVRESVRMPAQMKHKFLRDLRDVVA